MLWQLADGGHYVRAGDTYLRCGVVVMVIGEMFRVQCPCFVAGSEIRLFLVILISLLIVLLCGWWTITGPLSVLALGPS